MKHIYVLTLVVVSLSANAEWYSPPRVWGDLSWWGNSGATPAPVKDETRAGYWWYPTHAASDFGDTELWGNRGKIFHTWKPPAIVETPEPEPPRERPPIGCPGRILLNNVLFDFDKAVLKPEGKAEADKTVGELKKWSDYDVIVEGHTDAIGSDAYNMGLGERRAHAVRNYMIEQGIDAARITAITRGESEPVVGNDTPVNRKLNRRVEIHMVNK